MKSHQSATVLGWEPAPFPGPWPKGRGLEESVLTVGVGQRPISYDPSPIGRTRASFRARKEPLHGPHARLPANPNPSPTLTL